MDYDDKLFDGIFGDPYVQTSACLWKFGSIEPKERREWCMLAHCDQQDAYQQIIQVEPLLHLRRSITLDVAQTLPGSCG